MSGGRERSFNFGIQDYRLHSSWGHPATAWSGSRRMWTNFSASVPRGIHEQSVNRRVDVAFNIHWESFILESFIGFQPPA